MCMEVLDARTQDKILQILQEAYGKEEVIQWGASILELLQQTKILQSGMYESSVQNEAEGREELDVGSLVCPSVVAKWLLRDMREQQERGCSSQGRESAEQRLVEFTKIMSELPSESTQKATYLFDMWRQGKGTWLLQQALSQIQEIRQSSNGEREGRINAVVRRLTPLECTRLQNFPDGWVDIGDWVDSKGKKHKDSDSHKYRSLGNSIALPYWQWLAYRIVETMDHKDLKMGSLFSGIGGFELVFQRAGVEPVWCSEIDEFCIAVTKRRFNAEEEQLRTKQDTDKG